MIDTDAFHRLKNQVEASGARLIAVSKTKPVEAIKELYELGHRDFGENRAAEMAMKFEQLPKDIRWHMIGHLQRNKVKQIAPFVHTIHAVDSMRLLREINKRAKDNKRVINCLLQFHIAEEESKYGLDNEEGKSMMREWHHQSENDEAVEGETFGAKPVGVMGMATYTDNATQIEREFAQLADSFQMLKREYYPDRPDFCELSMGMSGDFSLALDAGSTMVRIGSLIFGARG
ncbi:MAG: YggS family pyridoxal phosphate-dependent enzyme [Bacteroidota bacterium]